MAVIALGRIGGRTARLGRAAAHARPRSTTATHAAGDVPVLIVSRPPARRPRRTAAAASASAAAAAAPHRLEADPVPAAAAGRDGRLRAAPLRRRHVAAAPPARDRRALHRVDHDDLGLVAVRPGRARQRAARAARHMRALHRRHRRHHLPARAAGRHLPPHGRPQLDRDRHRARRHVRRRDPPRPRPDASLPAPDGLADAALPHSPRRRDRPRREPHLALPPRARSRLALPDPRRLAAGRHARLPRAATARSCAATTSRSGRPSSGSAPAADDLGDRRPVSCAAAARAEAA